MRITLPQLQSIVLTDRAATPVNHTFTPRDITSDGVGTVVETTGLAVGENRLTVQGKKVGTRFKTRLVLACPIVQTETINGISRPTVVRTGYVDATFTFEETSTLQERTDLVGMFSSGLAVSKVLVNDTVVNQQGVY